MEINNKTAPITGQQDQNTISLDWQRLSEKVLPAPHHSP